MDLFTPRWKHEITQERLSFAHAVFIKKVKQLQTYVAQRVLVG